MHYRLLHFLNIGAIAKLCFTDSIQLKWAKALVPVTANGIQGAGNVYKAPGTAKANLLAN